MGLVQPEQVDSWLGQVGSLAALVGGLLAAVHTGRASDLSPAQEIAGTLPREASDVGDFSVYQG
ncbi:hypothetical protein, partial [Corynebacterium sp.]|uniref:hypothetical protein n=1 Tax=Corynebacterium sp. TaxID=1720 RepID=UPI002A913E6D